MENPWNILEAFAPMFDQTVGIEKNGSRYPVKACVFPVEQVDPFVDSDYQNDVKLVSILIPQKFYPKNQRPEVGDKVTLANTERYSVSDVADENGLWRMTARSR